jgi:hypothetical protein
MGLLELLRSNGRAQGRNWIFTLMKIPMTINSPPRSKVNAGFIQVRVFREASDLRVTPFYYSLLLHYVTAACFELDWFPQPRPTALAT